MAFLGRNMPTPLISESMAQVDDTILEAVCRNVTGGGHVDWTPHFQKLPRPLSWGVWNNTQ